MKEPSAKTGSLECQQSLESFAEAFRIGLKMWFPGTAEASLGPGLVDSAAMANCKQGLGFMLIIPVVVSERPKIRGSLAKGVPRTLLSKGAKAELK